MRNPWKPEICRMPDGSGAGADGGAAGWSDPVGGVGMGVGPDGPSGMPGLDEAGHGRAGVPSGAFAGPTGAGPSGYGSVADWGSTADAAELSAAGRAADHNDAVDLAFGYDALQGLPSSMAGNAYTGMDGMGLGLGLQGRDPISFFDDPVGYFGQNKGALIGALFTALNPALGAATTALGAHFVDGRGPGEAIGMGVGGLVGGMGAPGAMGMASSMAGSRSGASIGSAIDSADFTGDPGPGPDYAGIGGGSDFVPGMPGETYLPYLNPPTPQAPPQPAWRGLLGQTPAPQPNTWEGNRLFVPSRGLFG